MKKIFLLGLILLSFISCESASENKNDTADESEIVMDEATDDSVAQPIELILERIQGDDIPVECDYNGYMHYCWTWTDEAGVNYLLRTLSEPEVEIYESPDSFEITSQYLHVYHYRKAKGDEMELIRELTDFVKACEFDVNIAHLDGVELTDVDQDYIGEVTFGYRLACRSDVSSSDQKVILFEDGDKFILRGTSQVYGYGGDYEAGDEFDDANPDFLYQVAAYWDRYQVEYE